ncbi:MAG: ribosomal L7Ae/L30e/S12e/Gadd45 family protein [Limnochordaceae bacterium]|nr:ribosomal L7Ae/L30e/S12e/Gadd45 family protein [Limnochordaceae bacterium]
MFDGLLGLAVRARAVAIGARAVQRSLRRKQAFLVLLAEDAGAALTRTILEFCRRTHVPVVPAGTAESLGRQVGRERVSVLAVENEGFARSWQERHPVPIAWPGSWGSQPLRTTADPGISDNRGDVDD